MSVSVNLANAMQGARSVAAQGDLRAAFALLDRARDTAMASLGPDDPDVLAASGMLARLHNDLGELAEARRMLEEGLAAGERRLGDAHPVMLGLSYELARVADLLGNLYEARRRYGLVARLGTQALGAEHPYVRNARRYLGEQLGPSYTPPPRSPYPGGTPGAPGGQSPAVGREAGAPAGAGTSAGAGAAAGAGAPAGASAGAPSPWSAAPGAPASSPRERPRFEPVSPPAQAPPGRSPWAFAPASEAPPPDETHEDFPDRQGAPIYQPPPRGSASPWTRPAPAAPSPPVVPPPAVPPQPARRADSVPPDDRPVYVAGERDDDGYYDDETTYPSGERRPATSSPPAVPDPRGFVAPEPQMFDDDGDEYDEEEREFEDGYFDGDSGGFTTVGDSGGFPVVDQPAREVRGVPPKDVRDAPPRRSPWDEAAAQGGWGAPAQAFPTQRPTETPLPMSSPFGATPTAYPARPGTDLVMLPRPERKRSPLLAVLLILAVAVVGGGVAAIVAFAAARPDRGTGPGPSASAPVAPGAGGTANARTAPQNLTIRDNATSVTLTWTDPTAGTVPFIVAGGQQGAMGQLQSLTAGTTTYTINGLNPHLDYCFTVAAVYDTQTVALSQLACTRRGTASPKR